MAVRANNFDGLRIFAATLVIYGHSFPLVGAAGPSFLGNSVQTVAVKIFFVISGYLITDSWLRDPSVFRYTIRRALRIMPGLIGVILVAGFVVGPCFSTLSSGDYFGNGRLYHYLLGIFMYISYDLPGVFTTNPYPVAVNGSLWSLPAETLMYIITPLLFLGLGRVDKRNFRYLCVTIVLMTTSIYFTRIARPAGPLVYYAIDFISVLELAPFFLLGGVFSVYRIERLLNLQVAVLLLVIGAFFVFPPLLAEILLYVILPYLTLSIALASSPVFSGVGRYGDFSYGMYLYGFLVQQMLIARMGLQTAPELVFGLAVILTGMCAFASWHLLEKRMLSLKRLAAPVFERT